MFIAMKEQTSLHACAMMQVGLNLFWKVIRNI